MKKEEIRKNLIINTESISINNLHFIATEESDIMNIIFKTVTIPNTYFISDEWRIIGINHDSTKNTIDLCPAYGHLYSYFDKNFSTNIYEDSSIRKFLNNDFYDGFSDDIKNMMQEMSVVSNGKILHDKVKIPSLMEFGIFNECIRKKSIFPALLDLCTKKEGNPYILLRNSIVDQYKKDSNRLNIKKDYIEFATRDKVKELANDDDRFILRLAKEGIVISCIDSCDHKLKFLPIIRLTVNNEFSSEL